MPNKKRFTAARKVDSQWFYRYPRPLNVMFHNGSEFLGLEFKELLRVIHRGFLRTRDPTKNIPSNLQHPRELLRIPSVRQMSFQPEGVSPRVGKTFTSPKECVVEFEGNGNYKGHVW